MDVTTAVATRRSVRAFTDQPVDLDLVRTILTKAARAPSGGNVQPWQLYVVAGEPLNQLKAIMGRRIQETPMGEPTEYDIYPKGLKEPHKSYRFQVGEDMYGHLGIPREDKFARLMWFANNFRFFGAPVALFCYVDRQMGPPQWSDLGMYLQTVMLLLREAGLDSCAQECWSIFNQTIRGFLKPEPDPEWLLFCGMAIGHKDTTAPVNQLEARRAPLDDFCRFMTA